MTFKTKSPSTRSAPLYWFLIFAALFSLQVLPRLSQDAPVGDENNDIVNGFYYWKGEVISDPVHPPLAKALQALPLWTMGIQTQSELSFSRYDVRNAYFLTVLNRSRFTDILKNARFVTYLFGLALGWILFIWARQESMIFLLTLLTLWAFEPALLAFSGFAMADVPLTFFFLAAILAFQKLIQKPSILQTLLVGLLSGMAVTIKFTALLLIPIFLILEAIVWFETHPQTAFFFIVRRWLWGLIAACFWVCLIYLPSTLVTPGYPWPLALFFKGFTDISNYFHYVYYFRGNLSHQTHWDYYVTAFFLKSPLTFLFLLGTGFFLALLGKIKLPAWQWVPPLVFFTAFLFNHDLGLRMILPIYPFCFLMAAQTSDWITSQTKSNRVFLLLWAGLLFFQAMSVGFHYPAQVSYFNEMVPPERRLYWLGDSNLDFGQDTQRLAQAVQAHGWNYVKLAYFGTADPKLYGMNWSYWTQKDLQAPQPGWVYVINDEMIQLGPAFSHAAPDIIKSWILKVPPTGRIADTWYYFEFPGKIQPDSSPKILSAPVFLDDPNAFWRVKPFKPVVGLN